jgi:hypothetical protein
LALNNPVGARDPFGLQSQTAPEDKNYNSWGDMFRDAANDFRHDPQWNGGSPQRQDFSNGMNIVPPVALANAVCQVAAGRDPIAGRDLSGKERLEAAGGLAVGAMVGSVLEGGAEPAPPWYSPNPDGPYPYTRIPFGSGGEELSRLDIRRGWLRDRAY